MLDENTGAWMVRTGIDKWILRTERERKSRLPCPCPGCPIKECPRREAERQEESCTGHGNANKELNAS